MTLVISSHILAELQDYSSEMVIITDGRVVGGTPIQVTDREQPRYLIELATPRADLRAFLSAYPAIAVLEAEDAQALVACGRAATDRARLVRDLVSAGFELASFGEVTPSLEELYFARVRGGHS
jgi:ABC-2 type transport system ATP-binding protein